MQRRTLLAMIIRRVIIALVLAAAILAGVRADAQDIKLNVTYVCNGERMYVESCNIRDISDTSTCQVAHPDRPQHNGFMAYTTETRGALKKLLPTCTQPTAQEIAKEDAFKKKQQENYAADRGQGQSAGCGANRPAGFRQPGRHESAGIEFGADPAAQERRGARHAPLRSARAACLQPAPATRCWARFGR